MPVVQRLKAAFGRPTLALLAAVAPAMAAAQVPRNHLYDPFQLSGSVSLLAFNSTIRVDHPENGTPGTEIDAEDFLGLSSTAIEPHAAARWKPGRKHELELGIQIARRSAENFLIDDTLRFGDEAFEAGLRVDSDLRTDHLFLNYRYAFMVRDHAQLGLGVGLGVFRLNQSVSALAFITDGPDSVQVRLGESKHLPGPTASLGLFGRYRVGERLYLEGDARGIYIRLRGLDFINVRRLNATVVEGGAAARYFFSHKLAAELGYNLGVYRAILATGDLFGSHDDSDAKFHYTINTFRAGVVVAF